ncbi:globin family protein [Wenyingzhuangia aestuarii]|uniref:globin family protein n=1 Tax=Wenyingzhuangia aestuarii TaxID=1647582 RepID=UPI001ADB4AAC|nr:globin family protein [Wenyingzhuangia aestuarii]NJB83185.1 hemoglobin-like flavoprotein [Wenyingzhuangia aestuarii]
MSSFLSKLFGKKKTEAVAEEIIPAKTIELVQVSFEAVKPIAATAADIFYSKLFELDPKLKPLFPAADKDKMKDQGNKLMTMLSSAVAGLSNIEALIPVLQDLGKRHVAYRVEKSHYDTVGAALIGTLAVGLGDDFTPEVEQAWTDVYNLMASVMIDAAY